jgi:cytidyltransferase-like protein
MIIPTSELRDLAGLVTMVDGSFDPIHDGHIEYFRFARELGRPVLCNVAPDTWTNTKHPVLLPVSTRSIVLDAIRWIDFVHTGTESTAAVLELLRPGVYLKGEDWLQRGGIPSEELNTCRRHDIKLMYAPTVRNSSTRILESFLTG